jgi:hypothetical protein
MACRNKYGIHNTVRDMLYNLLRDALMGPRIEPHPFPDHPTRRPDILFTVPTSAADLDSRSIMIDTTVCSPFAGDNAHAAAEQPAGAAIRAALAKTEAYRSLMAEVPHLRFMPVATDMLGAFEPKSVELMTRAAIRYGRRFDIGPSRAVQIVMNTATTLLAAEVGRIMLASVDKGGSRVATDGSVGHSAFAPPAALAGQTQPATYHYAHVIQAQLNPAMVNPAIDGPLSTRNMYARNDQIRPTAAHLAHSRIGNMGTLAPPAASEYCVAVPAPLPIPQTFLCAPPSNALAQSSDATFSVSAPINGAPGPFPLHRPEDGAPTQDADNDATVDRPTLSKQLRAPAEDDDDDEAILLLGLGTARPGPAGISGSVGALARELSGANLFHPSSPASAATLTVACLSAGALPLRPRSDDVLASAFADAPLLRSTSTSLRPASSEPLIAPTLLIDDPDGGDAAYQSVNRADTATGPTTAHTASRATTSASTGAPRASPDSERNTLNEPSPRAPARQPTPPCHATDAAVEAETKRQELALMAATKEGARQRAFSVMPRPGPTTVSATQAQQSTERLAAMVLAATARGPTSSTGLDVTRAIDKAVRRVACSLSTSSSEDAARAAAEASVSAAVAGLIAGDFEGVEARTAAREIADRATSAAQFAVKAAKAAAILIAAAPAMQAAKEKAALSWARTAASIAGSIAAMAARPAGAAPPPWASTSPAAARAHAELVGAALETATATAAAAAATVATVVAVAVTPPPPPPSVPRVPAAVVNGARTTSTTTAAAASADTALDQPGHHPPSSWRQKPDPAPVSATTTPTTSSTNRTTAANLHGGGGGGPGNDETTDPSLAPPSSSPRGPQE